MFLANTLALQQAGYVDFSTIPDVEGGTVVRDGNGQPTGLFKALFSITPLFDTITFLII